MKLLIDIPEWLYQDIQEYLHPSPLDKVIQNGIPLEDIQAEIKTFTITEKSEYDKGFNDAVLKCFNALDYIGKKSKEEKK